LVPRLGEFLVRRGFLTEEQLQTALAHQRQNTEQGQQQMFGQSLLELKLISREQLDNAIMAQVLELQAALQTSNRQLEKRVADRTAELVRALAKVNEVNQLNTDFVSNISHELRTPLAQIKGYVLLLNDGTLGDLDPDQTTAVAASAAAIARLERLIEDLIRFASAAGFCARRFGKTELGVVSVSGQRNQIHAQRRARHRVGHPHAGTGCGGRIGDRHRHRHPRRPHERAFSTVPSIGRLSHPALRRHRAGVGSHRANHSRPQDRNQGAKPGRPRQHVLL
ncbi:MAG: hypothetical protein HZB20_00895, partial [Chloroflexi bacterium]|nr:hypothetical protein [Chloroflexota bacterium]